MISTDLKLKYLSLSGCLCTWFTNNSPPRTKFHGRSIAFAQKDLFKSMENNLRKCIWSYKNFTIETEPYTE